MGLPYFLVNPPLKNLSNLLLYLDNVGKFQPEIPITEHYVYVGFCVHR